MPKGKFLLKNSVQQINTIKQDIQMRVPALLGVTIGGERRVQIPTRDGYVYARIHGNLSELVQAYNATVAAVYDLPVVLTRDKSNKNKWVVLERDLGRYSDWGTSPYLPFHASTHSFNPDAPGADPVWVYGRQIMPLGATPSGSNGGPNVIIQQGVYYQNNAWHFAGGTGTADIIPSYKPTGSNSRMVLVYLNEYGNPDLLGGSTYFNNDITGTSAVLPYIPNVSGPYDIPLAAIRVSSGTAKLVWSDIYDLRPFVIGDGFIPTGTSGGHIIQDDGVSQTQRTNLNFVGDGFVVYDDAGNDATIVSGTSTGGAGSYTADRFVITNGAGTSTTNDYFNFNTTQNYAQFGLTSFPTDVTVTPDDFAFILGSQNNQIPLGIIGNINELYPSIYTFAYNGTVGSPSAVQVDDNIFEMLSWGMDNAATWQDGFNMVAEAAEDWTSSAQGTVFWIDVINTGSTSYDSFYAFYLRSYRAEFRRDIVLRETGTSASVYFGNPDVNGSYRLTQKNNIIQTQKRVTGTWTDVSSGGHTIQDDGADQTQRTNLNFVGAAFALYDDSGNDATIVSGVAVAGPQGLPGPAGSGMVVYDDSIYVVSGSSISFDTNLTVATTGSVAFVSSSGGGGHTIQDDGINQTARTNLNFVGPAFQVYDDAGNNATIVSGTSFITSSAIADLPSTGTAGRIFLPTDSNMLYYSNVSDWLRFGALSYIGTASDVPVLADFTWGNQGSGTATQYTDHVNLFETIAGGTTINMHTLYKTAPATPWTATAIFDISLVPNINNRIIGMIWRQSSDGKLVVFRNYYNTERYHTITKHANETGAGTDYTSTDAFSGWSSLQFFRITDTGSVRQAYLSLNGLDWVLIHSIGRTDYLTADQFGVVFQSRNASWPLSARWLSWKIT